jgi:molybdopterin-guanine dinucleotide biosynthesis protein A
VEEVCAFVLAGGKSSRMGRDKAALSLDGQTLLERTKELAKGVAERVRIVGPRSVYGVDAIEDVYPDCGPLGGIHAALTNTATDLNLILSVDTPFVAPQFLQLLVSEAARAGTTVTVPYVGERFQPLCAVYRREFLALAEAALRAGNNKIDALFCHTTVRRVDEAEIMRLAFDPRMFDNLNTPEDFERAQNRR